MKKRETHIYREEREEREREREKLRKFALKYML